MSAIPVYYEHVILASFLTYTLFRHEPGTTLVVCSDKQTFLVNLLQSIDAERKIAHRSSLELDDGRNSDPSSEDGGAPVAGETSTPTGPHPLLTRTLGVLAASRTIKVAFCLSVQALRAYLTTMKLDQTVSELRNGAEGQRTPTLALLNSVALHKETATLSAQALSETLASAVEASERCQMQLVATETYHGRVWSATQHDDATVEGADSGRGDQERLGAEGEQSEARRNPLDEEVPVLSSTTKMYGMGGDRSVMGKTVKVREVIERWCDIRRLPNEMVR